MPCYAHTSTQADGKPVNPEKDTWEALFTLFGKGLDSFAQAAATATANSDTPNNPNAFRL
jgi:hypothetical protein